MQNSKTPLITAESHSSKLYHKNLYTYYKCTKILKINTFSRPCHNNFITLIHFLNYELGRKHEKARPQKPDII